MNCMNTPDIALSQKEEVRDKLIADSLAVPNGFLFLRRIDAFEGVCPENRWMLHQPELSGEYYGCNWIHGRWKKTVRIVARGLLWE